MQYQHGKGHDAYECVNGCHDECGDSEDPAALRDAAEEEEAEKSGD